MTGFTFVAGDQRVLIESSAQLLNVRISVNGGEPVAIPAELCAIVGTAVAIAGRDAADDALKLREPAGSLA